MSSFLLRKARVTEDALTGLLADILTWWPHEAASLLCRARLFDGAKTGEPTGVAARHTGELFITPWPRWPSGEPDLVLEFRRTGGRSLVVIEAKLGADKSSTDGEELPLSEDLVADQLAKYAIDAAHGGDRRGASVPDRVDVVYLTHHLFAPVEDLVASHRVMPRAVAGGLFWLSWRDLERTLEIELQSAVGGRRHALSGLGAVLAQEGFARFDGAWRPRHAVAPISGPPHVFWTPGYAWRGPGRMPPPPGRIFFDQGR